MSTADLRAFVCPPISEAVRTVDDQATPLTFRVNPQELEQHRRVWQTVIDQKLIEWGRDPSQLADEWVDPPSNEIITLAIALATQMMIDGLPPPTNVVPDPNGGIVFERCQGDVLEVFRIWDDGVFEYQCFMGTRLVERRVLGMSIGH